MSIRLVCDGGCGKFTDDISSFSERGFSEKHHYCSDCVLKVDQYLKERDDLHDRVAQQWATDLKQLIDDFKGDAPDAVLPD